MLPRRLWLLALLGLVDCAPTLPPQTTVSLPPPEATPAPPPAIAGIAVAPNPNDREEALRTQAAADIPCPKEQVKLQRISLNEKGVYRGAMYLTDGCGQRAVYVSGWTGPYGSPDPREGYYLISKFAIGSTP